MQYTPTKLATFVALCCAYPTAFAEEQAVEKAVKLDEVAVSVIETSDSLANTPGRNFNVGLRYEF